MEFNYLETLAKSFVILSRQNHFNQENILNNAPVHRNAIALNTNTAFTRSYAENLFWYQQFTFRQNKIIRGGQLKVDFDFADICRLYVKTITAMIFQDDIPSMLIDNLKDYYVLLFDLTSLQDATENCVHPEQVGELPGLVLNFSYPLKNVAELILFEAGMSRIAVDKIGFSERMSKMDTAALQQIIIRLSPRRHRYSGSFALENFPDLPTETFTLVKTLPSNLQGVHWKMIGNSCHKLFFLQIPSDKKCTVFSSSTASR